MPSKEIAPHTDTQTRQKLVELARSMLESGGYSVLTLRALAKSAGLSPTAPYSHFDDGFAELLAAIAVSGSEELIEVLEKSARSGTHRERILAMSRAYVRFGVEHPDLYRAMFSPQIARHVELHDEMFADGRISFSSRRTYMAVAEVRQRAFEAIVAPLQEAITDGALKAGNASAYGVALAAMLYGLVGEFIDEGLGIRLSGKHPWSKVRKSMTEETVKLLLNGLESPALGRAPSR